MNFASLRKVPGRKPIASALALVTALGPSTLPALAASSTTPIQHIVVIFQENVSYDHYFATYPLAANLPGEPRFVGLSKTPAANGLSDTLLFHNPNSHAPFRLDRTQNYTCDQDHGYTNEQLAFDNGLMDKFPEHVGVGAPGCPDYGHGTALTMGYYDGNTVTALWNYAQAFALNDNSYGTSFGPSTVGALNLISGYTGGVNQTIGNPVGAGDVLGTTVIGDPDPFYDDCGAPDQAGVSGTNVGDLLTAHGVTWGWFEGGFRPTVPANGMNPAVCGAASARLDGQIISDYSAHHEPFQYYLSTANPHHLPPTSLTLIGSQGDQANHQYDLQDFWDAAFSGNLPAVSFLKAKRSQDGHAGYSSPLDEQIFLVTTLNTLQTLPQWDSTAVVIAYDDSDGWYDHQLGAIVQQSLSTADALTGTGMCGSTNTNGTPSRCGYGPRLPLVIVSPYAKLNFVDGTLTDQTSILRFIEDNWQLGRIGNNSFDAAAGPLTNAFDFKHLRKDHLFLDPTTGLRVTSDAARLVPRHR